MLALLVYQRPNLLLLDEPTNHLDLEMRQALATALQDFDGAMVIVSHDRHLLRVTCDQLLLVHSGRVDEFADELDAYPAWLTAHNRADAPAKVSGGGEDSAEQRRERKRAEAEKRKALQPLRRAVERAEALLEKLQTERGRLEAELADNRLYEAAAKDRLQTLLLRKGELDSQIDATEEQWMNAAEALEQATRSN